MIVVSVFFTKNTAFKNRGVTGLRKAAIINS